MLAAPAAALRPWTPPATAASAAVWSAFAGRRPDHHRRGGRTRPGSSSAARTRSRPRSSARITDGGTALLGVSGVDGDRQPGRGHASLGLVRNVAVLVNAPAADMTTLVAPGAGGARRAARGSSGSSRSSPATTLPVDAHPPTGRPGSYLAAVPGVRRPVLPGAVLDGARRDRPDRVRRRPEHGAVHRRRARPDAVPAVHLARSGASTAFGDTGPPDIMNPFDAVPSAARAAVRRRRRPGRPGAAPGDLRLQPRRLVRRRGAHPGRRVRPRVRLRTGACQRAGRRRRAREPPQPGQVEQHAGGAARRAANA